MPGALLVPVAAGANFLSSLLGNDAYANTRTEAPAPVNSQTMSLLSADVFAATSLETETAKSAKKDVIVGDISGNIVSGSALQPAVSSKVLAMGGMDVDIEGDPFDDVSVYVVRQGDSIGAIAEMFDVSVNTILWANDLKKGAPLKAGDTLLILPISGVKHTVAKGETLQSIAKKYKVDTLTITSFNGLEMNATLSVGEELIIPEAEMPGDAPSAAKKKTGTSVSVKATSGYYRHPLPEMRRRSQGIHGRNAVDLAAPIGTRILASASGRVLLARYGYNGGYGNYVIMQHANGTKTLYAHMSKIGTQTGAKVDQGEVIGYVGSTGRSTGPHLHFEIHGGPKNPF